jgi:hypothetical protein
VGAWSGHLTIVFAVTMYLKRTEESSQVRFALRLKGARANRDEVALCDLMGHVEPFRM